MKTIKYIIEGKEIKRKNSRDNRDKEYKDKNSFSKGKPKYGQRNHQQKQLKNHHINTNHSHNQ